MAERLFRSIGRPDLIDDPAFRTNADRVRNAEELDAIIGAFIAERTQAENVAFFEAAEVTIGPIYDIAQILEDPHFIEREILADYPDRGHGLVSRCTTSCRASAALPARSARPRRGSASTTDPCWQRSGSTMPIRRPGRIGGRARGSARAEFV